MVSSRMKRKGSDLGGFTIIEVVLVLAIAGLIFLMVFIALPALQRAQRDTQRRDDMAQVSEAITQYQTNNNGKLPPRGSGLDAVDETNSDALNMSGWCASGADSATNAERCFIKNYINDVNAEENAFADPDGWRYGLKFDTLGSGQSETLDNADFEAHKIYVWEHGKCEGESAVYSTNARDYAILYKLEGSGTYCQDNQ